MYPSLVEIRSVTSEIKRQKRKKGKKETTSVKYKQFGIAMPCGLVSWCYERHSLYRKFF